MSIVRLPAELIFIVPPLYPLALTVKLGPMEMLPVAGLSVLTVMVPPVPPPLELFEAARIKPLGKLILPADIVTVPPFAPELFMLDAVIVVEPAFAEVTAPVPAFNAIEPGVPLMESTFSCETELLKLMPPLPQLVSEIAPPAPEPPLLAVIEPGTVSAVDEF